MDYKRRTFYYVSAVAAASAISALVNPSTAVYALIVGAIVASVVSAIVVAWNN